MPFTNCLHFQDRSFELSSSANGLMGWECLETDMYRFAILFCIALSIPLRAAQSSADASFIGPMNIIKAHASTVPQNGDVNPYGVAVVPSAIGLLHRGHVLVSNFNNAANLQGTGTTIVQVSPGDGSTKLFAQINASNLPGPCPGGVGLTTALVVLKSGWVIVGSLPTTDGTSATAQAGCLLVLNSTGHVVETISGGDINGPWDMTALDEGTTAILFVTNVLNGTVDANGQTVNGGTVDRPGAAGRLFTNNVAGVVWKSRPAKSQPLSIYKPLIRQFQIEQARRRSKTTLPYVVCFGILETNDSSSRRSNSLAFSCSSRSLSLVLNSSTPEPPAAS